MTLHRISLRPCTLVYLILIAITVFTWLIGVSAVGGVFLSWLVLMLALVKGHLIGDYYMGLKWVKGGWRWLVTIWLILPGASVSLFFFLSYQ